MYTAGKPARSTRRTETPSYAPGTTSPFLAETRRRRSARRLMVAPERWRSRERAGAGDASLERGVRIQQCFLQRMRTPLGEVQRRETFHGADEAARVTREDEREIVGLALDVARKRVDERCHHHAEGGEHERQPGKSGGIGDVRVAEAPDAGTQRLIGYPEH